jgi:hypothetical protein
METGEEVAMVQTRSIRGHRQRRRYSDPDDVAHEIAGLSALNTKALKEKWLALWGAGPPPGLGRAFLVQVIAYRIQENAFGGLTPATRRFLRQFAAVADAEPSPAVRPSRAATAGTVLVREWHGTSHRVIVLDNGCTWRGKRYRSLSEVAREITGTRWSGPRFFGLGHPQEERRNGSPDA